MSTRVTKTELVYGKCPHFKKELSITATYEKLQFSGEMCAYAKLVSCSCNYHNHCDYGNDCPLIVKASAKTAW